MVQPMSTMVVRPWAMREVTWRATGTSKLSKSLRGTSVKMELVSTVTWTS